MELSSEEFRKMVAKQGSGRVKIRPYKPREPQETKKGADKALSDLSDQDRSPQGLKIGQKKEKPKKKSYKPTPQLDEMDMWMKALGIKFEKEFKFSPDRNYRADRHLPDHGILIEYEGLFSAKSRHLTFEGYIEDCRKYNLAASLGFKVYRYTAKNYTELIDLLKTLVKS